MLTRIYINIHVYSMYYELYVLTNIIYPFEPQISPSNVAFSAFTKPARSSKSS
jgi:hypothetical protein